jgi:hypothetical protein
MDAMDTELILVHYEQEMSTVTKIYIYIYLYLFNFTRVTGLFHFKYPYCNKISDLKKWHVRRYLLIQLTYCKLLTFHAYLPFKLNLPLMNFLQVKGKYIPLQAWTGPWGSRRSKLLQSLDNRHMKAVRLSALRTGRLYPQERFLVLISVRG